MSLFISSVPCRNSHDTSRIIILLVVFRHFYAKFSSELEHLKTKPRANVKEKEIWD